MFPAFVERPLKIRFQGQDDDEDILLLLRAHPIINLAWIIPAILIFFVPFFFPDFLILLNIDLTILPQFYLLALVVINYLAVLVIVFEGFLSWYFNVYIVTNKNIVDTDFYSVLFNNISITPLRNIEDANSTEAGLFGSLFNYGNVFVRTASDTTLINFISVPHPHQVANFVIDLAHQTQGG